MASIAFPLRLRQGQIGKTDERAAFEALLAVMARTPRGSWLGHPLFGFHDFFTGPAIRRELPEPTVEEINRVLIDLGLGSYSVTSISREIPQAGEGKSGIVGTGTETFLVIFTRAGIPERAIV
jgi:hypothetical protein